MLPQSKLKPNFNLIDIDKEEGKREKAFQLKVTQLLDTYREYCIVVMNLILQSYLLVVVCICM
jgi:hypothetical protein